MIKFFRKIRQKLFSENKFSKYLIYAIGEIILVVIGILIALSINTWNQNRLNSNKEYYYLSQLKVELKNQNQEVNKRLERVSSVMNIIDTLWSDLNKKGRFNPSAELNSNLNRLLSGTNLKLYTTTFDELISTGQLTLISSDSLRTKVLLCYQEIKKSQENIQNNSDNVFYTEIFPVISSFINFDYPQDMSSLVNQNYLSLKEQSRLAKAIYLNKAVFSAYKNMLMGIQEEASSTIELIELRLNNEIED
jgi:uncharacterized membrane-anchored protein YhcB (DUF1043 family)